MGKHKPTFTPHHLAQGDYVVVINARHAKFTGSKFEQKLYRWHTGYRLKETTPKQLAIIKDRPEELIKRAVSGMLPKNKLRKHRMKFLHIFPDAEHSFEAEVEAKTPVLLSPRKIYNS